MGTCVRFYKLIVILALSTIVSTTMAGSSENLVLVKIHSTRVITAHLSLGYDRSSLRSMAKRLSPTDVPTLFTLYAHNRDRLGVKLALASQCKASLDAFIKMVGQHEDANSGNNQMNKLDMLDVVSDISGFEYCDTDTRNQAKQFAQDLRKIMDSENAKNQEHYRREREEEKQRIYHHNLDQLKKLHDGSSTLPSLQPNRTNQ